MTTDQKDKLAQKKKEYSKNVSNNVKKITKCIIEVKIKEEGIIKPAIGVVIKVIDKDGIDRLKYKTNDKGIVVVDGFLGVTDDSDVVYVQYNGFAIAKRLKIKLKFDFVLPDNFDVLKDIAIEKMIFIGGCFYHRVTYVDDHTITSNGQQLTLPYSWQKIERFNDEIRFVDNNVNAKIPLSLGSNGRILIKFKQPVFKIEIIGYKGEENFEVRFGDQLYENKNELPEYNKDKFENRQNDPEGKFVKEFIPQTVATYNFSFYKNKKRITPRDWVEIRDCGTNSLAKQEKNYPGLDITRVIGKSKNIINNLIIIMDISGSMADNDTGDYYRNEKKTFKERYIASPAGERLYENLVSSIKRNFIPEAINENNEVINDNIINYSLVTFYGKKDGEIDPVSVKSYDAVESGNIKKRKDFLNLLDKEILKLKNNGYHEGTPLVSAVKTGMSILKERSKNENEANLMIVITDGAGENDKEKITDLLEFDNATNNGVIELIGYKIYPQDGRDDFLSFFTKKWKNENGENVSWYVQTHEAKNKTELDTVFNELSKKYNIKK